MSRLPPLDPAKFTPEQKALAPELSRGRDRIQGPFSVWIRHPPVADAANRLLTAIRQNGRLDKRLYELLVLTVVRRAGVQYAWAVHEPLARAAGIAPEIIEALRSERTPPLTEPDDCLIYEATVSLLDTFSLPDDTYQKLMKRFGESLTIEIVTTVGAYGMIGMVLNSFDVPAPNNARSF